MGWDDDFQVINIGRGSSNVGMGLGNNQPQQRLHLHIASSAAVYSQYTNSGTGAAAGDGWLVGMNADEDFVINGQETAESFHIINNGATRLTVDSNGATEMYGRVAIGSAASNATIDNNYTTGGLDVAVGNGTKAFQVWDDNVTGTPRFIVERGGNVGIGTASPGVLLHTKSASAGNYIGIDRPTSTSESGILFYENGGITLLFNL